MMYPEMSDEKLLQFYLSGNTAALATLTDLYKDRIYTTIFGLVQDKHVAEDIFRETFVSVINQSLAGKMPENSNFLQWAKYIAEQLCVEYTRRSKMPLIADNAPAETTGLIEYNVSTIDSGIMYYDCHSKLRSMIEMLPEKQREVVSLSHYAGMSFREIADRMKCSLTAVLDHMKNGLSNLRMMMLEKEIVLR